MAILCSDILKCNTALKKWYLKYRIPGFPDLWFLTHVCFVITERNVLSLGAYVANLCSKLRYILYDLMVKTKVLLLLISFWLKWVVVKLKGFSPRGAEYRSGATVKLPDDRIQKPDCNPAFSSIFGKAFHKWRAEFF